jgi:triacylglycerol esterase/lipase EstA (alpha/beta hydrolase family)
MINLSYDGNGITSRLLWYVTKCFWIWLSIILLAGCHAALPKQEPPAQELVPVLYVPGLGEDGEGFLEKWPELEELFKSKGYELKVAHMPGFGTIKHGADLLFCQIGEDRWPFSGKKRKFHIVAKSMGGLSARLMLHQQKEKRRSMAGLVMSLTTISTPHKGSEVADWYMDKNNWQRCTIPGELMKLSDYLGFGGGTDNNGLTAAGKELTTDYMKSFNTKVVNDNDIAYFSFSYKIDCSANDPRCWVAPRYPVGMLSRCWHDVILKARQNKARTDDTIKDNGANDGLVSVDSATWGTPIGNFEGEHFAETANPNGILSPLFRYKYRAIWDEVFGRVINNLDNQNVTHPYWDKPNRNHMSI